MINAIETDNLTKTFGTLTAVDRLTLTIPQGELFGLVGSDGAGKTTTMRMLTGIMDPTSGNAAVLGHELPKEAEWIKENIGYMSQRFGLYPDLTVLENIRFYADIYGLSEREFTVQIDKLLGFSNLTPFKKRLAGNLSGGMKQKLGLACALVHTPKILFLDEPTNGVDPVSRRDFWRILQQLLLEGVTIFVSTAYLDEAERCHRVGLIHNGRLLATDTPANLKKLVPDTILELRTTEGRRTLRLLREKLPQLQSALFGDKIHLRTAEYVETNTTISALLHESGIAYSSLAPIVPSLEDVFVYMIMKNQLG